MWNSSPGHVVEAETVEDFKIRLELVLDSIWFVGKLSTRHTLVVGKWRALLG